MPKIKDIILETKKIEWSKIKDLQPIGLKNDYHSDKTKQSIIENGFSRAIYVWLNPEDQETYIIDGHLRTDLLNELVDDGYDVPNRLNCTFLDLPDKQTAIKYLFQVFNTKTNPINKQSMDDWLSDININIEDINVDIEHLHIEIQIPEIQEQDTDKDMSDLLNDKLILEIHCNTELELQNLYNDMNKKGYKCKILTL